MILPLLCYRKILDTSSHYSTNYAVIGGIFENAHVSSLADRKSNKSFVLHRQVPFRLCIPVTFNFSRTTFALGLQQQQQQQGEASYIVI